MLLSVLCAVNILRTVASLKQGSFKYIILLASHAAVKKGIFFEV